MSIVFLDDNEPIERVLKRFKKECQKAGVLKEVSRRRHFEKPSVKRRRKLESAKRKARRNMLKMRRRLEMY